MKTRILILLSITALLGCAAQREESRLVGSWIRYAGDDDWFGYVELEYRQDAPSYLMGVHPVEDEQESALWMLDGFTVRQEQFVLRARCVSTIAGGECREFGGFEKVTGTFPAPDRLELQLGEGARAERLLLVRADILRGWKRDADEIERQYLESLQEGGTH